MVVLVLVAGQDAVDTGPNHLQEGVLGEGGVAGIIEGVGEGSAEFDVLVELADGQQPGVAGELALGRLDDQKRAEKIEGMWPGRRYTHGLPPGKRQGPSVFTG